ncbi:MAG: lysophospholipid acyltransferase family protein [Lachnospiraceae bacterium]
MAEDKTTLLKKRQEFDKYKQKKQRIISSDSNIPMKIRKAIRPLLRGMLWVSRKLQGYEIEILNRTEIPRGKPVIFAVSHIAKLDFEIISEVIKQQYFVLAADFIVVKGKFPGLFFWLNGVVYIDVLDKDDRKNSRDLMVKILEQNGNIMIFPEGAWNLSPNEIFYDIQLGAVDMALETGAVIIPISLEQYEEKKKFVINMGDVIDLNRMNESTRECKLKKTSELRDILATLKYEIWEREGITKRSDIKSNYWSDFVLRRCAEWPGYDFHGQIDNCYIPKAKLEYWDLMRDLRNMKVSEANRFLFMKQDEFLQEKTAE